MKSVALPSVLSVVSVNVSPTKAVLGALYSVSFPAIAVSPIEALKFQNFAPKKTKSRNSTNGGKLHVMAFHNVFRDKKRAILVFMSLFMGITMILGVNGVISSMSAENFIKEYMDYNFEYNDIQFEQPEQLNKEVPQFDEHFVEQIKQIDGVENVDIQKTVWAGIDFDETALEGFMKIQYEDSRYKSKGQSYEQMIEALKGYADAGDYGCYIKHFQTTGYWKNTMQSILIRLLTWKHLSVAKQRLQEKIPNITLLIPL